MLSKLRGYSLVLIALAAAYACSAGGAPQGQSLAGRLAALLKLAPGMTVAEVGAGEGEMTVELARILGERGHVFSTEMDDYKLDRIRYAVEEAGVTNVTVVEGRALDSGLPEGCCDAILMRRVYHHFTEPEAMNASIFKALRPGGSLAIVDFPPSSTWRRPRGVSRDRGGHGMPPELLIEELKEAGFTVLERIDDWNGREFCVVARRPGAGGF